MMEKSKSNTQQQESHKACVTQHPCMECACAGETCCMDPWASLMVSDIERICAMGNRLEDFATLHEYSNEGDPEDEDWWRESMVENAGRKYRIILKTKDNGHCVFLIDKKGCVLGSDRPLTCRIYPYWFTPKSLIHYSDKDCLFVKCGTPLMDGINMMTETQDTLADYYNRIAEDCKKNKKKAKEMVLRLLASKSEE